MSILNRFHNWVYGTKRLRQKGCRNVGVMPNGFLVRYDWSKPFVYKSKRYSIRELLKKYT